MIKHGRQPAGTLTASVDLDTRSDPILPRSGMRIALSLEAANGLLGSSYRYVKTWRRGRSTGRCRAGTRSGFTCFAGGDRGRRALLRSVLRRRSELAVAAAGAGHQLLDAALAQPARHQRRAAAATISTRRACWSSTRCRSGGAADSSTGGDAFAAFGLFGLASLGDSAHAGTAGFDTLPIDLTGDLGLRLDTYIGIFTLWSPTRSGASLLMRAPLRPRTASCARGAGRVAGGDRRRPRRRAAGPRRRGWSSRTGSC